MKEELPSSNGASAPETYYVVHPDAATIIPTTVPMISMTRSVRLFILISHPASYRVAPRARPGSELKVRQSGSGSWSRSSRRLSRCRGWCV